MGQEEVEFYRRLFPNPNGAVAGSNIQTAPQMMPERPAGVYPMPKIETQESVNQRIRKLEEGLANQKDVSLGLRMLLDATNRAMLDHVSLVQKNFEFLQAVGNDLHNWATRFLDEYNARHTEPPMMYPPELPPGFAFTPDERKVTDEANSRHQELLNENATLRWEYDAIHASMKRAKEDAAQNSAADLDLIQHLRREVAELKKPKPAAKKPVKKKPASK